jgi:hypothetical protein
MISKKLYVTFVTTCWKCSNPNVLKIHGYCGVTIKVMAMRCSLRAWCVTCLRIMVLSLVLLLIDCGSVYCCVTCCELWCIYCYLPVDYGTMCCCVTFLWTTGLCVTVLHNYGVWFFVFRIYIFISIALLAFILQ